MELDSLDHAIFRGLGHNKVAALEDVVEGYGSRAASDDGDALHILGQIAVNALLGHGVNAGNQAFHKDAAIFRRCYRLLHLFTGDREADTGNDAVLRGFLQVDVTGRRLHIQIPVDRISVLHTGHYVLQVHIPIGDDLGAGTDSWNVVAAGRDADDILERLGGADRQRVPGLGHGHSPAGAGEIELRQNAVRVRQREAVSAILVLQIFGCDISGCGQKAGDGAVPLHQGDDRVIDSLGAVVRLIAAKLNVIDGRADLAVGRRGLPTAGYIFPDDLRRSDPFFIVTAAEIAPVALVSVQQGKADSFSLTG